MTFYSYFSPLGNGNEVTESIRRDLFDEDGIGTVVIETLSRPLIIDGHVVGSTRGEKSVRHSIDRRPEKEWRKQTPHQCCRECT